MKLFRGAKESWVFGKVCIIQGLSSCGHSRYHILLTVDDGVDGCSSHLHSPVGNGVFEVGSFSLKLITWIHKKIIMKRLMPLKHPSKKTYYLSIRSVLSMLCLSA